MELVQKLMKKTSKYLFYGPMTEKVLTECPCICRLCAIKGLLPLLCVCVVVKNWDNPLNRAGEENMVHPRNHHMTYTSIIICGHKHKIEINEAEEKQPR